GALTGVPGHLDLQDPVPRGPEAAYAAAHARRLPALRPIRRLAAAYDPAPAARRGPAAAGDPTGARPAAPAHPAPAARRVPAAAGDPPGARCRARGERRRRPELGARGGPGARRR